jgi:hypothetical protein
MFCEGRIRDVCHDIDTTRDLLTDVNRLPHIPTNTPQKYRTEVGTA